MKRILSVLAVILSMVMLLGVLGGCQGETNTTTTPTTKPTEAGNKVTVYWYEGSKELKSEEVEKGATISSWTPTSEGKEFQGWFAEASLTEPFDFTKPITEDTDIFAAFKSNEYTEDTNNYYLIGAGAGDMAASAWDHAKSEAALSFTKDTTITDKNVYTITIKMYAGDQFQICFGQTWDGQQGLGHIVGAEYADGVNANDGKEYTAADKKYGVVKDAQGNVVFEGSDQYNKGFEVWNAQLAAGQDGVYRFTYTTYPGNTQYNEITWELVEKIEPMTETHEMYLIGSFNSWTADDTTYPMKKSEDGSHWIGFITITPDHFVDYAPVPNAAAMKVINHIGDTYYGDPNNGGENFGLTEGTYCVKYTVESNLVEIQKLDYYVVGTFVDAEGNAVNFAVKEGVTPKLVNGTVTFEATDVTGNNNYTWMVDQGKPGVMAIKVVFGCEFGIQDWYSAEGGDNWYIPAGTVTVTLNEDGTVTVA